MIVDRALRCLLLSLQNSVNRILATKQPNYLWSVACNIQYTTSSSTHVNLSTITYRWCSRLPVLRVPVCVVVGRRSLFSVAGALQPRSEDHLRLYSIFFLPRDAMRKRGLCCRLVSIRPSVTLVHCIQTAEDIVKLLSRPGSPITLVFFDSERRCPIPRWTPSAGAQSTRGTGWENFAIFDWNCRLSRKRYEIGPWLLWNDRFRWHWVTHNPGFKVTSRISQKRRVFGTKLL